MKKKTVIIIAMQIALFSMGIFVAFMRERAEKNHAQQQSNFLPDALLYEGEPIDPSFIIATQFGDSSHSKPRELAHVRDKHKFGPHTNQPCKVVRTCDPEKKRIVHKMINDDGNYIYDSYRYIESYNGKHFVLVDFYDTCATGRFSCIGAFTRDGDYIQYHDTVASGDRGWGGYLKVESLHDGVLEYSRDATPDFIMGEVGRYKNFDGGFPPCRYMLRCVYKVDLNKEDLRPELLSIRFEGDDYRYLAAKHCRIGQQVFFGVVNEYVKEGKKELDKKESALFARVVHNRYFKKKLDEERRRKLKST